MSVVVLSEAEYAALRAQVASMAALLEALKPEQPEPHGCPHLETIDHSTFRQRDVRCKACGASIDEAPQ